MKTYLFCILAAVQLLIAQPSMVGAVERAEAEETARLLAKLLQSGRMVIERNQALIDDPHKGEKGFTPELFEQQLVREFLAKTGIDLTALPAAPVSILIPPLAKELLPALVQASREVVRDAQVVINQRGIGYKNFIPATYGSQASARFSKSAHVRLKQTAIEPRNPKNEPDEYEASVLKWLSARPRAEAYVSELTEGGEYVARRHADLLRQGLPRLPRRTEGGSRHLRLYQRRAQGGRPCRGHHRYGPADDPKMRRHASVGILTTGTNADCRLSGLIRRDEHQDFQPLCRVILHSMLIAGRSHGALARSQHLLV
jgi:hypothetical protein